MKTRAAVLRKGGTPREITDLELDPPKANEHEASGIVVDAGPGVTRVKVGDRVSRSITRQYTLDEINEGYQDLMDGKNIRGVIAHQH